TGAVSLNGAILNVTVGAAPIANGIYTLINNDGTDPVSGTFTASDGTTTLNNGDSLTLGGKSFRIFYTGGDGNDVMLFETSTPTAVYVSSNNFGLGSAPVVGQVVDGDQGVSGTQAAVYGFTAFSSIAGALSAVTTSGSILLNAGTYAESPSLVGSQTLKLSGG